MESEIVSSFFLNEMNSNLEASLPCQNMYKNENHDDLCDDFLNIIDEQNISLEQFKLPSNIDCVYNPTIYARHTFELYIRKYCNTKKPIMYFGMNPGPWGMSQTGVPFGEISSVRDWLGISGPVEKPPKEVSTRLIKGFACTRTEVSGKRFWGLFKNICGTPDNFFKTSFVYNYLPQQWMKSNGCNLTPGDFRVSQMEELFNICDPFFIKVLQLYEVEKIIAVGKFCEVRATKAIKKYLSNSPIEVLYLSHPSPRSVNNNDWDQKAVEQLKKLNLLHYYS